MGRFVRSPTPVHLGATIMVHSGHSSAVSPRFESMEQCDLTAICPDRMKLHGTPLFHNC